MRGNASELVGVFIDLLLACLHIGVLGIKNARIPALVLHADIFAGEQASQLRDELNWYRQFDTAKVFGGFWLRVWCLVTHGRLASVRGGWTRRSYLEIILISDYWHHCHGRNYRITFVGVDGEFLLTRRAGNELLKSVFGANGF